MQTKEGLWKLSPSGLYGFEDCKTCFWAENHIGKHPFTLPLRLNDAMDSRLKSRYDHFRKRGEVPPELKVLKGIHLFPDMKLLDEWRNNRTALRLVNEVEGYMFDGKIDELFVNQNEELLPADYKSSGDPPKEDKQKYYRLQLAAYALMFEHKGYRVADKGYLLHYFTKDRNDMSLAMEISFHPDEVNINLTEFKKTMHEIVSLLNGPYPGPNEKCERCVWLEKRRHMRIS